MSNIDQRIVEMQFDNRQFESGVKTTLSTLDRLKAALKFDGASKGLENIQTLAGSFNMSGISNACAVIETRFSAMGEIAVAALQRITNKAIDTGEHLLKSLTVDNISAGWEKFGSKTQSVGTLVSQGYGLDTVNEQLNKLNWFTDETSYNFTDMVGNIAKFTATGKDLESSVTAMEGIALWAALSGQNATTASRAMYQLSQAMGAGVMRKEDYKSIQNASMDTDEFRQKAIDAAIALGKLKENSDGTYSSLVNTAKAGQNFTKSQFANSLTEGQWFDDDVMMEVFKNYSGAVEQLYAAVESGEYDTASEAIEAMAGSLDEFQLKAFRAGQEARTFEDAIDSAKDAVSTGWMNTFELIFGNYEEAKTLWTDLANTLYDIFAEGGNARNEMLKVWKELGGRDSLIATVVNLFHALESIVGSINQSFRSLFPPITAERLFSITKGAEELTNKFKNLFTFTSPKEMKKIESAEGALGDSTIRNLKEANERLLKIRTAASGFFSILELGKNTITTIASSISNNFSPLVTRLANDLLNAAAYAGTFFSEFRKVVEESGIVQKIIEPLAEFVANKLSIVFDNVENFFNKFPSALEAVDTLVSNVTSVYEKIKDLFTVSDELREKSMLGLIPTSEYLNIWKTDERVRNLKDTFGGIVSIFELIKQAAKSVFNVFKTDILPIFAGTGDFVLNAFDGFLRITGAIGRFITGLSDSNKETNAIENSIRNFVLYIKDIKKNAETVFNSVRTFVSGAFEKLKSGFESISGFKFPTIKETFESIKTGLGDIWDKLEPVKNLFNKAKEAVIGFFGAFKRGEETESGFSFFELIGNIIGGVVKALSTAASWIGTIFQKLRATMTNSLGKFDPEKFFSIINGFLTSGLLLGLNGLIASFKKLADLKPTGIFEFFNNILHGDFSGVSKILDGFTETATNFANGIKEAFLPLKKDNIGDILEKIAISIAILTGSLVVLSMIDSNKLILSLISLGVMLKLLSNTIKDISALTFDTKSINKVAGSMIKLGVTVLLMSFAMRSLSSIDTGSMILGLIAVKVLITTLIGAISELNNKTLNASDLKKSAKALISASIAILILSAAVKKLGELAKEDGSSLMAGLASVAVLLAAVAGFIKFASTANGGISPATGIALIEIAAAILILQNAVKGFGELSKDSDAFLSGLFTVMILLASLGAFVKFVGNSKGMMSVGTGLVLLAASMLILTGVFKELSEIPIDTISNGLLAFGGMLASIAIALAFMPDDTLKKAVGLVVVGVAIRLFTKSLKEFAGFSPDQIGSSLIVLAGSLLILAMAMDSMKGSIGGAAAMLVMAVALDAFIPALLVMSSLSMDQIGSALLTLAGVFLTLGVAGYALGPVVLVILSLAGALALIGLAVGLAGAGILALSVGLMGFEGAVVGAAGSLVAAIGIIIMGLLEMVPLIISLVGQTIISICQAIGGSATAIGAALTAVGLAIINVIVELGPPLLNAVLLLLTSLLVGLAEYAPTIMSALIDLVVSFINGIADQIRDNEGTILNAIKNLLASIIVLVLDFFADLLGTIPGIGGKIRDALHGAGDAVDEYFGVDKMHDTGEKAATSLADGFAGGGEKIAAAAENTSSAIESPIKGTFDSMGSMATGGINGVIGSFIGGEAGLSTAASSLSGSITNGFDLSSMSLETDGEMQNVLSSLNSGDGDMTALLSQMSADADGSFDLSSLSIETDTSIESMLSSLNGAQGDVSSAASGLSSSADSALSSLNSVYLSSGESDGSQYASGLSSKAGEATQAGTDLATGGLTGTDSVASNYETSGQKSGENFANGITTKSQDANRAGSALAQSGAAGASTGYSNFYTQGLNAGQGYVDGLNAKVQEARVLGAELASAAMTGTATAQDSNSPAKEFIKLGSYGGEGYVIGLRSFASAAGDAGNEIAEESLESVNEAVANIVENFDSFDANPTIRPVLDLSNVTNGVGRINEMIGKTNGINLTTAMDSIGSAHFDRLNLENQNSPAELSRLVALNQAMLEAMQQGGDVYLNENLIVGRINRRLGAL